MTGPVSRADLAAAVDAIPSIDLGCRFPTPLEDYPRLAAAYGLRRLLVKRDDLTAAGLGGNKVRELEFFLGQARAQGADVFVAGGGVAQSNHARQCAAAARRAGLDVHLVLRRGLRGNETTGNLLVTTLYGAEIHWVDEDPGLDDREGLAPTMNAVAADLRRQGRRPWVLHSSFHPLGGVGYVRGALELMAQLDDLAVSEATIVSTSMGATRIGIELAARLTGTPWDVVAAGWRPVDDGLPARLADLARRTADLLGHTWDPGPDHFTTLDHGGPAYGVPSPAGLDAVRVAAQVEGLVLDPVYTGKGFSALIAEAGRTIDRERPVVFVHTGGLPALFAYGPDLTPSSPDPTTR